MTKTLAEKFSEATGIHEPYASEILNNETYASWRLPSGSVHQDREELIGEISSQEEPEETEEDQEAEAEEDPVSEEVETEPETVKVEPEVVSEPVSEEPEDSKIDVE